MLGIGIDYAIQMHARVEEEVVIDRAPHPIQETSRNLGPALLVVTFDAIFAFAALRFAKVPMLREFGLLLVIGVAAICLNSIMGTLAILGIREYRSPTKGRDFREGPLGRLTVRLGSLSDAHRAGARDREPDRVRGRHPRRGQARAPDRPDAVGQPALAGDQEPATCSTARCTRRASSACTCSRTNVFGQPTVTFVDDFTRDQLAASTPTTLLTASGLVSTVSELSDVPGAPHLTPTSADVRAAYDVAPHDIQLVDGRRRRRDADEHRSSAPGRAGSTRAPRSCARSARRCTRRPAFSATPSGLAVVGVGLLDNLEANRVAPHLPRDPLRVPVPHRPAAQRRPRAAVARPGVDRGRRVVAVRVRARASS